MVMLVSACTAATWHSGPYCSAELIWYELLLPVSDTVPLLTEHVGSVATVSRGMDRIVAFVRSADRWMTISESALAPGLAPFLMQSPPSEQSSAESRLSEPMSRMFWAVLP